MTTTQKPGIDPRAPRFGAGITGVLLLVVLGLDLSGFDTAAAILFAVVTLVFAWGALAGIRRHPYGALFKTLVRPRLSSPTDLEDPTPPTFAQGVGLAITGLGLVLHLLGVPLALSIATAAAFIAAFLNSVFGYCLGCQVYLLLVRVGILGRNLPAANA